MSVVHFENRDYSVAESAALLAESLQSHLETPVTVADAVAMTGLPFEESRAALSYLAVRNNARVTFIGDDEAYIFTHAAASIGGSMPSTMRAFGRYVTDLLGSQIAYFLGALVTVGPAFVGITMFDAGLQSSDLFQLLAGGTLAFGAVGAFLHFAIRSATVLLPPLLVGGIVLGWERWTTTDFYWLPLVLIVALAMQADMLWTFRKARPAESLRLLFWGEGFKEPLRESKRLADLITNLGGTVTVGDLMRAFGWSADEAGEKLAGILMEYGGDVAVDPHGRLYLRFEELADTKIEATRPKPAYAIERKAPGPFAGLDVRWVGVVAVVCWIGLIASPLNSAYTAYVSAFDVTLEGAGRLIRSGLAGLFTVPLFVYFGRLLLNVLERPEFAERRRFLDALEYADQHPAGSHVSLDKFSTEHLVALNAYIDEERSIPGAIWVEFPDLRTDLSVQEETVFDALAPDLDASGKTTDEVTEELEFRHAAAEQRR